MRIMLRRGSQPLGRQIANRANLAIGRKASGEFRPPIPVPDQTDPE